MTGITIIIPTKNAEPYIEETLQSIFAQETDFDFETLVIDSGSKDNTLNILSSYPVRLVTIPSADFNHGETRNKAIKEANPKNEYIAFLSQDATPNNPQWLQYLIEPFLENPEVAGVYSRHIPRPNASASVVRQVELGPTGGQKRLVNKIPASPEEYEANRMSYIFFSNTSSAIRRRVWEEIPFDRVDFAEDTVWADKVLKRGYITIFEPNSIVLHSHDISPIEQFRQNVDHAYAINHLFHPDYYRNLVFWLRHFVGIPFRVVKDSYFALTAPRFSDRSLWSRCKMIAYSPLWQIASVSGAWIGAHLAGMPPWLKNIISRQERIRNL